MCVYMYVHKVCAQFYAALALRPPRTVVLLLCFIPQSVLHFEGSADFPYGGVMVIASFRKITAQVTKC
jgi:hypothetical protein